MGFWSNLIRRRVEDEQTFTTQCLQKGVARTLQKITGIKQDGEPIDVVCEDNCAIYPCIQIDDFIFTYATWRVSKKRNKTELVMVGRCPKCEMITTSNFITDRYTLANLLKEFTPIKHHRCKE